MRNTSPTSASASNGPSRRTKYRCKEVACRSKIPPNAAGRSSDAAITSASDASSTPSSSPLEPPGSDRCVGQLLADAQQLRGGRSERELVLLQPQEVAVDREIDVD